MSSGAPSIAPAVASLPRQTSILILITPDQGSIESETGMKIIRLLYQGCDALRHIFEYLEVFLLAYKLSHT
jgi:hypothetical protein